MVVTTTKPELIPAVRALRKTRTAEADKVYWTTVDKLAAGEFLHPEDVLQCLDDCGRSEDELQAAILRLQNRAKWQADLDAEAALQTDLRKLEAENTKARAEYDALVEAFQAKGQFRFEKIQNLNARLSAFADIRAKLRETAPTDEAERLADLGAQLGSLNWRIREATDFLSDRHTFYFDRAGNRKGTLHASEAKVKAAIDDIEIREKGGNVSGNRAELPGLKTAFASMARDREQGEKNLAALRSQRDELQRELTAADAAAMKA